MSEFDAADLDEFLSDFAVTATAWGVEVQGIFDREYVEASDVSGEMPTFLLRTSDVPSSATSGDEITIDGTAFQLVDKQYAEPGLTRIILALA